MAQMLKRIARSEDGATAIEYGLIAALIFVAIMGAVASMAGETVGMWNGVANKVVATAK
ncbi:Flp family type IVb pilin [Novosphingopyxis sp.]|uniref:Flp family type IVb pilin n=1 Tax=Novosphingopyxis sp. TaxID=2709690 RepID=UPI003B5C7D6F